MRNDNQVSGAEERGIPGTTTRKKTRVRSLLLFVVAIVLLLAVVGASIVTVNRFTEMKLKEKQATRKAIADKAANSGGPQGDLSGAMNKIKQDEDRAASEAAAASAAAANLPTPAGAMKPSNTAGSGQAAAGQGAGASSVPQLTPAQQERQRIDERRLQGDVSIFASSDAKASGPSNGMQETLAAISAAAKVSPAPSPAAAKKTSFEEQLTPSTLAVGQASLLPDLDYLIQRGTMIRCGVVTRVVSTWPGAVKCTVLEDVYSANGHTLVVRAGAQAFGEQRNAVTQGQARIFVLWDEIDDGKVKITLDSPAADALGGSGMEAYVDNHFWLRFGGAMMVSVISDFGQALANKSVGGGTSVVSFSGSSNTADSAAEQALKSTIDIPPTAYTNQGAVTNIFVARHIDMSSVYKVINDE
jgi:type IV secretion system protein VirB10